MKKIFLTFILFLMAVDAYSAAITAQSTVIQSARSLIEKENLEGRDLERVKFSFISLLAIVNKTEPSLIQGPALKQTAMGDLSDSIKQGDIYWEVKYYNSKNQKVSAITLVNEKTQQVFFMCRSYKECKGK